jgi:recombinational DNA repair protein (RecF pathway)
MKCEKCGDGIDPDETYEHSGRTLCEDCYLDIVAAPKTCDPWAVYSAKNTVSQEMVLTEEQQKILDLIKAEGPLTLERSALSWVFQKRHFEIISQP